MADLQRGARELVLDLTRTVYLDAAALNTLVSLAKRVREQGGDLRLVNPNGDIRLLLDASKAPRLLQDCRAGSKATPGAACRGNAKISRAATSWRPRDAIAQNPPISALPANIVVPLLAAIRLAYALTHRFGGKLLRRVKFFKGEHATQTVLSPTPPGGRFRANDCHYHGCLRATGAQTRVVEPSWARCGSSPDVAGVRLGEHSRMCGPPAPPSRSRQHVLSPCGWSCHHHASPGADNAEVALVAAPQIGVSAWARVSQCTLEATARGAATALNRFRQGA